MLYEKYTSTLNTNNFQHKDNDTIPSFDIDKIKSEINDYIILFAYDNSSLYEIIIENNNIKFNRISFTNLELSNLLKSFYNETNKTSFTNNIVSNTLNTISKVSSFHIKDSFSNKKTKEEKDNTTNEVGFNQINSSKLFCSVPLNKLSIKLNNVIEYLDDIEKKIIEYRKYLNKQFPSNTNTNEKLNSSSPILAVLKIQSISGRIKLENTNTFINYANFKNTIYTDAVIFNNSDNYNYINEDQNQKNLNTFFLIGKHLNLLNTRLSIFLIEQSQNSVINSLLYSIITEKTGGKIFSYIIKPETINPKSYQLTKDKRENTIKNSNPYINKANDQNKKAYYEKFHYDLLLLLHPLKKRYHTIYKFIYDRKLFNAINYKSPWKKRFFEKENKSFFSLFDLNINCGCCEKKEYGFYDNAGFEYFPITSDDFNLQYEVDIIKELKHGDSHAFQFSVCYFYEKTMIEIFDEKEDKKSHETNNFANFDKDSDNNNSKYYFCYLFNKKIRTLNYLISVASDIEDIFTVADCDCFIKLSFIKEIKILFEQGLNTFYHTRLADNIDGMLYKLIYYYRNKVRTNNKYYHYY